MRRDEAINLLKRRQTARKTGNDKLLHRLDKQISAAVSKKEWPEMRTDSAPSMSVGGPGSKWEEHSGQYIKARPRRIGRPANGADQV